MKEKVEGAVERGRVGNEDVPEVDREVFGRWTSSFTRQDHPTVIQVLRCFPLPRASSGSLLTVHWTFPGQFPQFDLKKGSFSRSPGRFC